MKPRKTATKLSPIAWTSRDPDEFLEAMECRSIRPGMIFDWSQDDRVAWRVIKEGTFYIKEGKRVRINNELKNKWWCQKADGSADPMLCCFDIIFDNTILNFRWPEESDTGK